MRVLISPTSSRNTVPFGAISRSPGLSRYAPVKLPRTWPKSSDSRSESGRPAQLTVTRGAAAPLMNEPRDDFLPDACLARDQDLRVGARRALDVGGDRANSLASSNKS